MTPSCVKKVVLSQLSENVIAKNGLEPLKRAITACESAGTGAKVMCHIGGGNPGADVAHP
jgi:microcystin degradation protein MlrC